MMNSHIEAFSSPWLLFGLFQVIAILLLAPLMTGISRQIRARMQSRRGPGVLQEYRDIVKLLTRQDVSPNSSGMMFRVVPFVLVGSMLTVIFMLPLFTIASPLGIIGDMIAVIYLCALFRFFFSLSGIDSGSPFAGLGASRELMLGILVEPIMILGMMVAAFIARSTNLTEISATFATHWGGATPTAAFLAMIACAFALFIEMGKIPFDYAEAEQELQEGPLTEYSGTGLALVKVGLALKQIVMASLFITIFLPTAFTNIFIAIPLFLIKLFVVYVLACIFENTLCRGRFLLSYKVTWTGFGISLLAYVFYLTGL